MCRPDNFFLLNPATHEYAQILDAPASNPILAYGFGYVSSIDAISSWWSWSSTNLLWLSFQWEPICGMVEGFQFRYIVPAVDEGRCGTHHCGWGQMWDASLKILRILFAFPKESFNYLICITFIWVVALNFKCCPSFQETLSLSPEYDFQPNMFLLNCVKLIYNQGKCDMFSTILRHYIIKVCLSLPLSFSFACEWSSKRHDLFILGML